VIAQLHIHFKTGPALTWEAKDEARNDSIRVVADGLRAWMRDTEDEYFLAEAQDGQWTLIMRREIKLIEFIYAED
jgi:hypothetical protein